MRSSGWRHDSVCSCRHPQPPTRRWPSVGRDAWLPIIPDGALAFCSPFSTRCFVPSFQVPLGTKELAERWMHRGAEIPPHHNLRVWGSSCPRRLRSVQFLALASGLPCRTSHPASPCSHPHLALPPSGRGLDAPFGTRVAMLVPKLHVVPDHRILGFLLPRQV